MDPKKQELNPELKEIYDRVMNTQVKNPQNTTASTAVSAGAPQPGSFAPPVGGAQSAPQNPSAPPPPQTSAPVSPNLENKPFIFTGNKLTQAHSGSSKKISKPIIAVFVVILIVVWGLFWAKFFGLF